MSWRDVYSAQELAAALHKHAAILAKRHGYYAIANELLAAAEAIDELDATQELPALPEEHP